MHTKEESTVYGISAQYDTPEKLLAAAQRARKSGYLRMDAHSPFPVEGMSHALGVTDKWVIILMLIGGFVGCLNGLLLQYWASVASYPLNVGGRPIISWPQMVVILFESTVLTSALTGVFSMIILNGLPELYHPMFGVPDFERASQDRFFLCIEERDKKFDMQSTRQFLEGTGALRVDEVTK